MEGQCLCVYCLPSGFLENVTSIVSTSLNSIFASVPHLWCKEKILREIRKENIQCERLSFAVGIFTDLTVKPGHLQVQ